MDFQWEFVICSRVGSLLWTSTGNILHAPQEPDTMDCGAEHLTAEYKNEEVGLYPNKPTSAGKSNRSETANSAAIAVGRTRLAVGWTRPDRLSVSPDYVFQ